MSKYILIFFFAISCKYDKLPDASQSASKEKNAAPKSDMTENKVSHIITMIEKSAPAKRKKYMDMFVSIENEVDGATAEMYHNFAFDYEQENGNEFYIVLKPEDTLFLYRWAKIAESEIRLLSENSSDIETYLKEIELKNSNREKTLNLKDKSLSSYYFNALKRHVIANQ